MHVIECPDWLTQAVARKLTRAENSETWLSKHSRKFNVCSFSFANVIDLCFIRRSCDFISNHWMRFL